MKKIFKSIVTIFIVILVATACGKKYTIKDYLGHEFSGKDPWGNNLTIAIQSLDEDKLTWTYTDVFGSVEESFKVYEKLTTNYKDDVTIFTLSGKTDRSEYLYDYMGKLTFKDGKITVKYENGQIMSNSQEGGSSSHNVGALDDEKRIVVLEIVKDNS